MKKPTTLLLATALAGTLGLAGLSPAFAHDRGGDGHGWRGDGRRGEMMNPRQSGGPAGMLNFVCSPQAATRLETMLNRIEERLSQRLDLNTDQQALLADLKAAALSAQTTVSDQCAQPSGQNNANLIERLQQHETNMKAVLSGIDSVMPSLEKFYASLSDSQKAQLDRMQMGMQNGMRRPMMHGRMNGGGRWSDGGQGRMGGNGGQPNAQGTLPAPNGGSNTPSPVRLLHLLLLQPRAPRRLPTGNRKRHRSALFPCPRTGPRPCPSLRRLGQSLL